MEKGQRSNKSGEKPSTSPKKSSPANASRASTKKTIAVPKKAATKKIAPKETTICKVLAVDYEVFIDSEQCVKSVHPSNINLISHGNDSDRTVSYDIQVGDVVEAKLPGMVEMIRGTVKNYTYKALAEFPLPQVSTTDLMQQRLELNRGLPITNGVDKKVKMAPSHNNERRITKDRLKACAEEPPSNIDILEEIPSTIMRWYPNCNGVCEKHIGTEANEHVHPIVAEAMANKHVLVPGILPPYDTPKPTSSSKNGCIHAGVYASSKHASTTQCCACVFPYDVKHSSVSHHGCRISMQIVVASTTIGVKTRPGASASDKEQQQFSIGKQLEGVDTFKGTEFDFTISQSPESPVQVILRTEAAALLRSVSDGSGAKNFGDKLTSTEYAPTWRDLHSKELSVLFDAIMGEKVSTNVVICSFVPLLITDPQPQPPIPFRFACSL